MQQRTIQHKQTSKSWVNAESLLKIDTSKYLLIPHSDAINFTNTDSYTIAYTVSPVNAGSSYIMLNKRNTVDLGDSNYSGIQLYYNPTTEQLIFNISAGGVDYNVGTPGTSVKAGRSYNVVVSVKVEGITTTLNIYLNGILSGQAVYSSIPSYTTTRELCVGRWFGASSLFQGDFSCAFLSIYNKALSQVEVSQLYDQIGIVPKSLHANCVGFWSMQEKSYSTRIPTWYFNKNTDFTTDVSGWSFDNTVSTLTWSSGKGVLEQTGSAAAASIGQSITLAPGIEYVLEYDINFTGSPHGAALSIAASGEWYTLQQINANSSNINSVTFIAPFGIPASLSLRFADSTIGGKFEVNYIRVRQKNVQVVYDAVEQFNWAKPQLKNDPYLTTGLADFTLINPTIGGGSITYDAPNKRITILNGSTTSIEGHNLLWFRANGNTKPGVNYTMEVDIDCNYWVNFRVNGIVDNGISPTGGRVVKKLNFTEHANTQRTFDIGTADNGNNTYIHIYSIKIYETTTGLPLTPNHADLIGYTDAELGISVPSSTELIPDPNFNLPSGSGGTQWAVLGGWSIASGAATCTADGQYMYTDINASKAKTGVLKIVIDMSISTGGINFVLDHSGYYSQQVSTNGITTIYVPVFSTTDYRIHIHGYGGCNAVINSISVTQYRVIEQTAKLDFYTKQSLEWWKRHHTALPAPKINDNGEVLTKSGLPELKNAVDLTKQYITFPTISVTSVGVGNFSLLVAVDIPENASNNLSFFTVYKVGNYVLEITRTKVVLLAPDGTHYLMTVTNEGSLDYQGFDPGLHLICFQKVGIADFRVYDNGRLMYFKDVQTGYVNRPYSITGTWTDIDLSIIQGIGTDLAHGHLIYAGLTTDNLSQKEQIELYNNGLFSNPKNLSKYKFFYQFNQYSGGFADLTGLNGSATAPYTANQLDPAHADYTLKTINSLR